MLLPESVLLHQSMNTPVMNMMKQLEISAEQVMPKAYKQLYDIQRRLENIIVTCRISSLPSRTEPLYMLQCRVGKRNGVAAVRMATDMVKEKLINARLQ